MVSFNAPAFESYGKEQSFNAPVGNYAAYAYTTALNHLLADRDHTTTIGDTTIVYWSEDGEEIYQNVFAAVSEPTLENQEIIDGVFKNLAAGRGIDVPDVEGKLSADQKFYILGLAPNAARIAVRFFYQDSFGNILRNIKAHYDRMKIVRPATDGIEYLGIWRMLQDTVKKKSRDKK
ncbi:MAG: type I-C CRISPR-associated protein Cas8c/Csd1, partial [Eisenbergiella sp.]